MNVVYPDPNIRLTTSVRVDLSPSQWELRTEEFDRKTLDMVASHINRRVEQGFNKGLPRQTLKVYVAELLHDFSIYGGHDAGPLKVLNNMLNLLYKTPENEYHAN